MTLFVGVDGGGTHTRAVIVDGEGRELARGEAGGAVVSVEAPERSAHAVAEAVRVAAARADVALPVDVMWAGLAGAGLRAARAAVAAELEALGVARRVVVGTDVEAAFHDAFGEGPGVLLIAGTGSIAWARGVHGETVRVGGWGERLGDEGSGFAIGMAALRAVARAEDGRGPKTQLVDAVLEGLALDTPDALIPWSSKASKGDVAGLVPLVARVAAGGDALAAGLLSEAVPALCEHLRAVLERAGPWPQPPELVLWGGLLAPGGALRQALIEAVGAFPARLRCGDIDPALGAARLARASAEAG